MSFYATQGTLPLHAPSYVEREADRELLAGLLRGDFCYVLTSRQMGKSSLMVRTAQKLREQGTSVVVLDLAAVGINLTPEQWYDGLIVKIGRQLRIEDSLDDFWLDNDRLGPVQRLFTALREVVLPALPPSGTAAPEEAAGRLVIFIDEIDIVRGLPFLTDELFAAIRECHNSRVTEPEYRRLTFALMGTATPAELIRSPEFTPFHVGRGIELTDFTPAEAGPLARGLGRPEGEARVLLERVLGWTNGHPYLTQRLCQALAADPLLEARQDVDRLCEELFLTPKARERDDNLLFVRERLLRTGENRSAVLQLYDEIRSRKNVPDDETNPAIGALKLAGIVRLERGLLTVRNRIYHNVFDRLWIQTNSGPRSDTETITVAVLPFVDLSLEHNEYFSDGLTDELINALGQYPRLRIASRSSVFPFKGQTLDVRKIGEKLGVAFVVEGSIRRVGGRVRISIQILSVDKGHRIWSGSFKYAVDDIHMIQEQIATEIVRQLTNGRAAEPPPRLQPANVEAYKLYLKGLFYLNGRDEESLKRSLEDFEEAVARDPEYAPAYAGMADACIILGIYNYRLPHEVYPRAKETAIRALEIDENLAEAHCAMGCIHSLYDWDWRRAEASFLRAISLNPSYSTAHHWYGINCLTPLGRHDQALTELRMAQAVDPLSIRIPASMGLALHFAGRNDEAIAQFLHTLEMDAKFWLTYSFLGCAYLQKQMVLEAVAAFQAGVHLSRNDPGALASLAHAYTVQGRADDARKILAELVEMSRTRHVAASDLAMVHLGLQELDQARECLERAHQQREFRLVYLRVDPRLAALRGEF